MSPVHILIAYCALIILSSLFGGWLPSLVRLTHTRLQLMMSAVGGLMLGIGVFHLLPHAVGPQVSLDRAIWWLMMGLLTTFFLIRIFHYHQHAPLEQVDASGHEHEHDHNHLAGKHHWVGIFLGLSLHTFLDGVALGTAVLHDAQFSQATPLFGFAVFLGVLLHKPLDSLSITSLMAAGGWRRGGQVLVNFTYAMMCPIGAALLYFGVQGSPHQEVIVGCALAFAAGIFICISMGDLLPELSFHSHDRVKLTLALLLGVSVAYGIGFLEPDHVHAHASHAEEHHSPHPSPGP